MHMLFANPRGVAFAAFASSAQLATLLGCDLREAERFKATAHDDFQKMMAEARRGRA